MSLISEIVHATARLEINLLLLGFPLALGLAIAFRLTRGASRTRYLAGVIAFFAAALLPVVVTLSVVRQQEQQILIGEAGDSMGHSESAIAKLEVGASAIGNSVALQYHLDHLVDEIVRHLSGGWLVWLWLTVAVLLLCREAVGHVRLARSRRTAQAASAALRQEVECPNNVRFFIHEKIGPCTIGLLRPAMILPERLIDSLPRAVVKQIARHELAHARWRDPLINAVTRLVCVILWPSLPLWILERLVRIEREAAADRAALNPTRFSPSTREAAIDYAESLISIARWSAQGADRQYYDLIGTPAGNAAGLEDRIRRVLGMTAPLTGARRALASAVILAGLSGMALMPIAARPVEPISQKLPSDEATLVSVNTGEEKSKIQHGLTAASEKKTIGSIITKPSATVAKADGPGRVPIREEDTAAAVLQNGHSLVAELIPIPLALSHSDGVDQVTPENIQARNQSTDDPASRSENQTTKGIPVEVNWEKQPADDLIGDFVNTVASLGRKVGRMIGGFPDHEDTITDDNRAGLAGGQKDRWRVMSQPRNRVEDQQRIVIRQQTIIR